MYKKGLKPMKKNKKKNFFFIKKKKKKKKGAWTKSFSKQCKNIIKTYRSQ
jgi:hypothetical protein